MDYIYLMLVLVVCFFVVELFLRAFYDINENKHRSRGGKKRTFWEWLIRKK